MDYLIMCIGNRDGGDDAVGPYVAKKLKNSDFKVIDCGIVPENFTSVVKEHCPNNLIIIDAVDMGLKPGEIRIVPKGKIGVMHISTHGTPLSVLIKYLEQHVKNVVLIGIQPKTISDKMTDTVKKNAEILIKKIKNNEIKRIPKLN
jgi:hydrogenase 3 maturation protease